jgi:hypothetical protein
MVVVQPDINRLVSVIFIISIISIIILDLWTSGLVSQWGEGVGGRGSVSLELFFRLFFLLGVFRIIFIISKSLFFKLKWAEGCVFV